MSVAPLTDRQTEEQNRRLFITVLLLLLLLLCSAAQQISLSLLSSDSLFVSLQPWR